MRRSGCVDTPEDWPAVAAIDLHGEVEAIDGGGEGEVVGVHVTFADGRHPGRVGRGGDRGRGRLGVVGTISPDALDQLGGEEVVLATVGASGNRPVMT